jgi:hypothetical protein
MVVYGIYRNLATNGWTGHKRIVKPDADALMPYGALFLS